MHTFQLEFNTQSINLVSIYTNSFFHLINRFFHFSQWQHAFTDLRLHIFFYSFGVQPVTHRVGRRRRRRWRRV